MIKNYLKVAFRNLRDLKGLSVINIVGLAVGIASCIVILLYVAAELGYDRFNENADQIYRIHLEALVNGGKVNVAMSARPLGPTLAHNYPEVAAYTRIKNVDAPTVKYKDKVFSERKFYWVDSTFFDVFTVSFLEGDPKTALATPNTIVITESVARKYFGNENPVGKILGTSQSGQDYLVTGVVKEFPPNAHFHFDFLGSLSSCEDSRSQSWVENPYYTYVLLRKGTDPDQFQSKLRDVVKNYPWAEINRITKMGIAFEQFEAAGNRFVYRMQPLTSIHLHSHLDYELEPNSDISYVYIFSVIAVVILLLAIVNFMNLATARSEKRAKEVGIRKALGSNRSQLAAQFFAESILTSLLAVLLAIVLIELFAPMLSQLTGLQISLDLFASPFPILGLLCFGIVVGIVSGSYPAFYLSSFRPIQMLKKGTGHENRRPLLRDGLIIFQFAVSIVLFVGTLTVYSELLFIQNKNLGFNKEQVIVLNGTEAIGGNKIKSFRQELVSAPRVISATSTSAVPGMGTYGLSSTTFNPLGNSIRNPQQLWILIGDYNLLSTYQMKLAQGRFFDREYGSDSASVVLNEAAVAALAFKDPLGKEVVSAGSTPQENKMLRIIGVVKDFNFESLHQPVHPLAIFLSADGQVLPHISIRVAPGDYPSTISSLETIWHKFAGNQTFDYTFLDQGLASLYKAEQRTATIAATFSGLAIFIACLGLFGLAAFVTEQRTKEIGIRKILGATVSEIVIMLSKQFTIWVLVANVVAWPIAYYMMNNWLRDFAYRINISVWIFAVSGLLALAIALLTVSSHAIKAATANPVQSLRYE